MNTTKPEHTPTPWVYEKLSHGYAFAILTSNFNEETGQGFCIARTSDTMPEADAQFIVTAVNAYDENQRTIAELRELIKFAASEGITDGWRDAARAALERSKP